MYKFTTMYQNYMKTDNIYIQRERERERERERFGLRTTSSTTSRGDFWALRASTPIFRQCRIAASHGSRRSAASVTGMSPAPPCTAMAHPISTLSQAVSPLKSENRERQRADQWFAYLVLELGSIYLCIKGESREQWI